MTEPVQGQQAVNSGLSQFNAMAFLIQQMIAGTYIATPVKVMACTNVGGVTAVGFVDAQILVNQTDGAGLPVPHVTVYNLPYCRLQGGLNAVILDPQVGDIGIAVFAHSDITGVKATKGQANPGSGRRNSVADGMYIGGILNGVPTQFVQFLIDGDGVPAGIVVKSPVRVTVEAPDVLVNCTTAEVNAATSIAFATPTFTVN